MPKIADTVYVHPSSVQMGEVEVGDYSSLWPCSVMRGDFGPIKVGRFTSIQDGAVLHAAPGLPVKVGSFVTVAHLAMLHGCTVEDDCMISMHAVVQDRCVIGAGSIVGAGAVVKEGTVVPPGSIVVGVPGKIIEGKPGLREMGHNNGLSYAALAMNYREGKHTINPQEILVNIGKLKQFA